MVALLGNEIFLGVVIALLVTGIFIQIVVPANSDGTRGIKRVLRYFLGSKKRAAEAKVNSESAEPATSNAK
jgi:hypothetical protein